MEGNLDMMVHEPLPNTEEYNERKEVDNDEEVDPVDLGYHADNGRDCSKDSGNRVHVKMLQMSRAKEQVGECIMSKRKTRR
ncbi:hypothetical protein HOY80DRAFT_1060341 [Tuber brumale]|nr:hypothetical protein HOY80DRAFT_1060341 [Tuber brumale]